MSEPVKIKMTDGKPEFKYDWQEKSETIDQKVEGKKVAPDDALECDIKNEMSGSYGASSRGQALGNLAYSAASAASAKGLSHKLRSDIHAHASALHAKASEAYDSDGDKDAFKDMGKHHKELSERHSKISAEMMK